MNEPASPQPPSNSSIERAIAGDWDFDIGEIISEAWEKTEGAKWPFNIAISIYGSVYLLLVVAVPMALSGFTTDISGPANVIGTVLNLAVCYPIMAGLLMMGVRRADGASVEYGELWQCMPLVLPIAVLTLAMLVMLMLGFMLLVIPGIYLAVAYMYAMLLVVDKRLDTWEALETSRKAITHHWFKVFGLMFVMSIFIAVSALPLGFGLIWTMPMFYILNGLLYRRIFGTSEEEPASATYVA